MDYQYEFRNDAERHECISWVENDALIFRCRQCEFIRKIDLRTGRLSVLQTGNQEALHSGAHLPVSLPTNGHGQN